MNTTTKKMAAIALSMCMATGAAGIAGYAALSQSDKAFAQTLTAVAEENIIGVGVTANVTVTTTEPATVKIGSNVAAGNYVVAVKVTTETTDFYSIYAKRPLDKDSVFLYDDYDGALGAVMGLLPGDELTIGMEAFGDLKSLDMEVYLLNATFSGYQAIQISKTIPATLALNNVSAGNYNVVASIDYGVTIEANAQFFVKVDDGKEVELTTDASHEYTYEGKLTVPQDAKNVTFTTTSTALVNLGIEFIKLVEATELPTETPETLTMWETMHYKYTAATTGYFTITPISKVEDAAFNISLVADPNDFDGESIRSNTYPIYMAEGKTYYFNVYYSGYPMGHEHETEAPKTADVKFEIGNWTNNVNFVLFGETQYIPVTIGDMAPITGTYSVLKAGEYNISVTDIPDSLYGYTVTAHVGNQAVEVPFRGTVTVELQTSGTIYFTSTASTVVTVGAAISYTPAEEVDLSLNASAEVTIRPLDTTVTFLEVPGPGTYYVNLLENSGSIQVDGYYGTIISAGQVQGTVTVTEDDKFTETNEQGEVTREYYMVTLFFRNASATAEVTVKAIPTQYAPLQLGVATEITLSATENSKTYCFINLPAGEYDVFVTLPTGVQIKITMGDVTVLDYGESEGYFEVANSGTVALVFDYNGETDVTFTVTVRA